MSWFPELGQDTRRAKEACRRCLVLVECRSYAMATPELAGIWGATDRRQ